MEKKADERAQRVKKIIEILTPLFPEAKIALNYSNNWELLVAVMLSAQCTDVMVNKVTERLFTKYKNLEDYAAAAQNELEQDIFQTGFYRNKARNIIAAAHKIKTEFNGKVPETMEELVTIPGVGRKTANVVLSNAFGTHEGIAVDTHVRRFAIRFDLSDHSDPKRIERDLMEIVEKKYWNTLTYLLIEYGREICPARKHECSEHPLTQLYPKAAEIWPKAK